jgi:L-histidine N-alpha-methyltransferase
MGDERGTARPVTIEAHLTPDDRRSALEADARAGLTASPKRLSPVWFYDERGSALFDEITRLPEYYPTRCERALLLEHAGEIAVRTGADTLVELGSGTSDKTRVLLDVLQPARYVPLDVDAETLALAAEALSQEYPGLHVHALAADFHRHLDRLPAGGRRLVAFLGGTIGNLRPAERASFLAELRSCLEPDDWFLLGADLVKDVDRLVAAYDDAAGVTAEFNRNALRVLNRELDADFDPETFDHVARWVPATAWIEMRLRSRVDQKVTLSGLDLMVHFEAGEELLTEISAKFELVGLTAELADAGFAVEHAWLHGADDFSLLLARPA